MDSKSGHGAVENQRKSKGPVCLAKCSKIILWVFCSEEESLIVNTHLMGKELWMLTTGCNTTSFPLPLRLEPSARVSVLGDSRWVRRKCARNCACNNFNFMKTFPSYIYIDIYIWHCILACFLAHINCTNSSTALLY